MEKHKPGGWHSYSGIEKRGGGLTVEHKIFNFSAFLEFYVIEHNVLYNKL